MLALKAVSFVVFVLKCLQTHGNIFNTHFSSSIQLLSKCDKFYIYLHMLYDGVCLHTISYYFTMSA